MAYVLHFSRSLLALSFCHLQLTMEPTTQNSLDKLKDAITIAGFANNRKGQLTRKDIMALMEANWDLEEKLVRLNVIQILWTCSDVG